MKYIDEDRKVRTLIAKRYPFKGVESYFTESLLYQDSLEMNTNPQPEEPDSSNKADIEPEAEEECLWELNPLVTSINKLDVNNTANDVGEWHINKDFDLAYLSVFASDSLPSDTSIDVSNDPWSAIDALTSLHVPVRSSLTVYQDVSDVQGSLLKVPASHKGQRLILFRMVESKSITREDSESKNEPHQFSHYEPNVLRMMENMGYDLTSGLGLNFGKGRRTLLRPFIPKGKAPDYYHRTRRGLGYVSTPISSASESEESLYHDHSSDMSSWGVRCQYRQHLQRTFGKYGFDKPPERWR